MGCCISWWLVGQFAWLSGAPAKSQQATQQTKNELNLEFYKENKKEQMLLVKSYKGDGSIFISYEL